MKDPIESRQPERERVNPTAKASHDIDDAGDMHAGTANAQLGVQTKNHGESDACALK